MPFRVMQVVDSLAPGGAERLAVNLANSLANEGHESHLGTTRAEGRLAGIIKTEVGRLRLKRAFSFDPLAFVSFAKYLRRCQIQVIHAHSSAVYISLIGAILSSRRPRIVWHLHQGKLIQNASASAVMRLASRRVDAVIAVSRQLADWATEKLLVQKCRVHFIANYVRSCAFSGNEVQVPGTPGFRIVCVGNLRPEKDTLNLLAAMSYVLGKFPQAHLILVGGFGDQAYTAQVKSEVTSRRIAHAVTFLGPRDDVPYLLPFCDVAVLSSVAEGFPLVMLEYGSAGLATISTRVGACSEILDNGTVGVLVEPSDPAALGSALVTMLMSPDTRVRLGSAFRERVEREYGEKKIVKEISEIYHDALRG